MRICDWSSGRVRFRSDRYRSDPPSGRRDRRCRRWGIGGRSRARLEFICLVAPGRPSRALLTGEQFEVWPGYDPLDVRGDVVRFAAMLSSRRDNELRNVACDPRSEEHTSELQSLMRLSYAVFCLKKKTQTTPNIQQ